MCLWASERINCLIRGQIRRKRAAMYVYNDVEVSSTTDHAIQLWQYVLFQHAFVSPCMPKRFPPRKCVPKN